MTSYARLIESVRRTRNTLYLIAGLYIIIGFVVAFVTAMQRDRVGTFFGFVIISGALSMGLIARTALQVLVRIARIEECLTDLGERLQGLVHLMAAKSDSTTTSSPTTILDLSAIGPGDPAQLAAAVLERDRYPRLVTAIEQADLGESPLSPLTPEIGSGKTQPPAPSGTNGNGQSTRTRDLLQQWKTAMAKEDLVQCRQVFSAMVDIAEKEELKPLQSQIYQLQDRLEAKLREQFTVAIRRRDFAAAVQVGEKMTALLADRPVAAEFARLRPILTRRADEAVAIIAN